MSQNAPFNNTARGQVDLHGTRKKSKVFQVFLTGFIELVHAILNSFYATLVPWDFPLRESRVSNLQLKNQSWHHNITSEGSKFRQNTSH